MICAHCAGKGVITVQVPLGTRWPPVGWSRQERPCDRCHGGVVHCCDGLQAVCEAIEMVEGDGDVSA